MADIVDIGSSRLDEQTNTLVVTAKTAPVGSSAEDAPGFGEIPLLGALGVTGKPYPPTADGNAQGVIDDSLPGTNGWITAARDTRISRLVGKLADGETVLHSTGPGFDAAVFCKDQLLALVVGDDMAIVIDRKDGKISITGAGGHFEVSREAGVMQAHGGAVLQVKDGVISLAGTVVLGGRVPTLPLCAAPAPVAGTNGVATAPTPGVFLGAG